MTGVVRSKNFQPYVSIHTPTKGVTLTSATVRWEYTVSIHTPTKGVTHSCIQCRVAAQVSIHTPTKGVTCVGAKIHQYEKFQSTHPRRVWLEINSVNSAISVSIHTPTKGVTEGGCRDNERRAVSIHTPTKGVTVISETPFCLFSFNPHTHEGCDLVNIIPTKLMICFNPHTHEGCDQKFYFYINNLYQFQSTHPRRVWLSQGNLQMTIALFQSTHPRRVWLASLKVEQPSEEVSIHTPTKGVTYHK